MPQVRKVASLRRLFHFLLRARFQTDSLGRRDDGGGGGGDGGRGGGGRGGGGGVLLVGGGQVQLTRR
jgi:hypothetical protein